MKEKTMILEGNIGDLQRLKTIVNNNWRTPSGTVFEEYYNPYTFTANNGENRVIYRQHDLFNNRDKYISFESDGFQSIYFFPYIPGTQSHSGFTFVPKFGNKIIYTGKLSGCSINIYDFDTHWVYVHDEHQKGFSQSTHQQTAQNTVNAINNEAQRLGIQATITLNRFQAHWLSIDAQDYAPPAHIEQNIDRTCEVLERTPIIFQFYEDIFCYMFTDYLNYRTDNNGFQNQYNLILKQKYNLFDLYRFSYCDVFIKVQYGENYIRRYSP